VRAHSHSGGLFSGHALTLRPCSDAGRRASEASSAIDPVVKPAMKTEPVADLE
jgi:hypothetical protein